MCRWAAASRRRFVVHPERRSAVRMRLHLAGQLGRGPRCFLGRVQAMVSVLPTAAEVSALREASLSSSTAEGLLGAAGDGIQPELFVSFSMMICVETLTY